MCNAWHEFIRNKRDRKDISFFSLKLSKNIFDLYKELKNKTYKHGVYEVFFISDPKPRSIHKATVRDRLLHHAIHRVLRTATKKRMIRNLKTKHNHPEIVQSYLGLLSHGNSWKLRQKIIELKNHESKNPNEPNHNLHRRLVSR